MNYLYELKIYGGEDGDIEIGKIEAYTLESLQEQLHKAEHAIKKYEDEKEMEAQMEMDRLAEDEAEYKEIKI
jgi:hypothetical protein